MNRSRRGATLVLILMGVLILWTGSLAALKIASLFHQEQKAAILASALTVSSLRVRGDALQRIAERWSVLNDLMAPAGPRALVERKNWAVLDAETKKLASAVPGYKGRITSIRKVVADAYATPAEVATAGAGFDLGVALEGQWIVDEAGAEKWQPNVWVRRTWSDHPSPATVTVRDPSREFPLQRSATARLQWDVDPADPDVRHAGNGGFPRAWADAVFNGRIDPYRLSFFRVERVKP